MRLFVTRVSSVVTGSFLALLLVVAGPGSGVAGQERKVGVLISHRAAPYQAALDGFEGYLKGREIKVSFVTHYLEEDPANRGAALEEFREKQIDLLFAIGSSATQAACTGANRFPIVSALVPSMSYLAQESKVTGVPLDFPVEIQLQWLRRLLPRAKTLGVLYSSDENQQKFEVAARSAQPLGLNVYARKVEAPHQLPEALDALFKRADVVWGLADKIVLTPQTAKEILLLSFRERVPLVAPSPEWVKAGALYSLEWDYVDIGKQCAEMALSALQDSTGRLIAPAWPRKVRYSLNLRTAQHMKLELPQELVQGANHIFQ